jgi:hypothetical protein
MVLGPFDNVSSENQKLFCWLLIVTVLGALTVLSITLVSMIVICTLLSALGGYTAMKIKNRKKTIEKIKR